MGADGEQQSNNYREQAMHQNKASPEHVHHMAHECLPQLNNSRDGGDEHASAHNFFSSFHLFYTY